MSGSPLGGVLRVPAALVLLAIAATVPTSLSAQQAVFSGRVTSEANIPLGGANVGVPELGVGTIAGTDGRYTFTIDAARARGRTVNVVARFIGYKPKRLPVTLTEGRTEHDFALERDVLNLEEVVVTGTSEAVSKQKTTFAVNTLDNTQIKEAPSVSPLASLDGKIAGVSVISSSGQPGSAPAIRLRSATSLTGRQDPLVIIDGTITRLSLADVNSEDIERVEVIKGAAASSLYGSDAANGVIQIFTKRGANLAEGQTTFIVRNEYGQNQLPKFLASNMHHNYKVNANGSFQTNANGDRTPDDDLIADNAYPVVYDQMHEVFKSGPFMTNYASVGQRRGNTNFNGSFQNTRETGVLTMRNGYSRQNFRLNVDQALTEHIDLGMGAFYGRSHGDQGEDTGLFFGMRFLEPNIKIDSVLTSGPLAGAFNPAIRQPPLSGNVVNPLYTLQQRQVNNDRDRFTGTFRAAYRPVTWLTFEGNVGYDESGQNYKSFTPLGFTNSSGASNKGGLFQQANSDRAYNTGVAGTATWTWHSLRNTTKAAFLYEDQTNSFVSANAPKLTVGKVTEFTAADQDPDSPVSAGSRTETIRNQNYFLVSTFEIKERYILDGLVRQDESSLFGSDNRSAVYHRVSGAYRLTQDVKLPGINELKLRASHGTAGLRPQFSAQYEAWAVEAGLPEKITLGNKQLKPAFSRETEYGVDMNFFTNYTFEYSYSKKRTTDEIIKVPLSAATGYLTQWQNAGTLEGHSHEAALGAVLFSKADYFWRVGITADRTRQKIADLKVGAFLIGPSGGTTNTQIFRIAKGEPFGVIYGSKWIRTASQLAETIKTGQLGGTAADYQVNEEGFFVRKSQYHTINEVPLKAFTCNDAACTASHAVVQIGDVNPDFNMGFNTNAQWKAFSLNSTLTWVKGGNIYNYTRQWPFNELRDKVIDQSSKPAISTPCAANWQTANPTCPYATGRKPTTYYSTFYNNFDPSDFFVEDGSYMRLRELAVNWTLPRTWVAKIPVADFTSARLGIVGRQLWTSTK